MCTPSPPPTAAAPVVTAATPTAAPISAPLAPPARISHKKKVRAPSPDAEEVVAEKASPVISKNHKKEEAIETPASAGTPGGARNRKRADSTASVAKKSHKKAVAKPASSSAAPVGLGITTPNNNSTSGLKNGGGKKEETEEEEGEETYCYCNQISYGEMVACDGEECEREWFHLDCVGLSQAPRGKAKWYCSDCAKARKGRT
ncbi:hypothetical protein FN846DRAFT_954522 [Sphaerosporella brunnea]|uniref:PHD-type domain-containing protein n=1 Tax=Sphaerosporella brunnea TaxID=1250544 RepID=A0A5J5EU14_9PEZI|nr:hypothetical protein FN846DRAFT_954522 [Sphaerosporella brunnea]